MQRLLQPQQLIPLAFHQSAYRNSRPAGHDIGDLLFGHGFTQQPALLILLGRFLSSLNLLLQLRNDAVAQLRRLIQVIDLLRVNQVFTGLLQSFFQVADALNR
ncbi:hypothetical protein D3C74_421990 [compost metagenome]